jgi:hypothetical protein
MIFFTSITPSFGAFFRQHGDIYLKFGGFVVDGSQNTRKARGAIEKAAPRDGFFLLG